VKSSVLKTDKFKRARGGHSRLLTILCAKCGANVCKYQKDGVGMLKRMYLDRMIDYPGSITTKLLACPSCKAAIGAAMVYKKEDRPAFRLFPGAVMKKGAD
jgi:hypothetical protein